MPKKTAATPSTLDGYRKEFIKLIRANAYRYDLWTVFSDFLLLSACWFSNAVDKFHFETREAEYLKTIQKYSKEEALRFREALMCLVGAMDVATFDDVLGSIFMELELGNKWAGQFFTPYHICHLMGQVTLGDASSAKQQIEEQGFITVSDPCVGGGAMVIGFANALSDLQINYQMHMHATVQDIDIKAVHMAYIQLSLLHIPAIVIHGNSLGVEARSIWYTPAHVFGLWNHKLKHARQEEETVAQAAAAPPASEESSTADPAESVEPPKTATIIELHGPLPAAKAGTETDEAETKQIMASWG